MPVMLSERNGLFPFVHYNLWDICETLLFCTRWRFVRRSFTRCSVVATTWVIRKTRLDIQSVIESTSVNMANREGRYGDNTMLLEKNS